MWLNRRVDRIIEFIQPNAQSEAARRDVFYFVRKLIERAQPGTQSFWFGSVPLRTYLPDGDIDVCAFPEAGTAFEWFSRFQTLLEAQANDPHADFPVKNITVVNADVKILKAVIGSIFVDISANKAGGIGALCFLEEVDRAVGKSHLFKRSVLLIKAWCMYESRILGSHHGLLSSFALETMTLFVINAYHKHLNSPLEVLLKFLQYFASFNWSTHCISINGPFKISNLPKIQVECVEDADFLLSSEFLSECRQKYGGSQFSETEAPVRSPLFVPKHMNIMDPLYDDNNIGRSVSQGSSLRIQAALKQGLRLLQSVVSDADLVVDDLLRARKIDMFFRNSIHKFGIQFDADVESASTRSIDPNMILPNRPDGAIHARTVTEHRARSESQSSSVDSQQHQLLEHQRQLQQRLHSSELAGRFTDNADIVVDSESTAAVSTPFYPNVLIQSYGTADTGRPDEYDIDSATVSRDELTPPEESTSEWSTHSSHEPMLSYSSLEAARPVNPLLPPHLTPSLQLAQASIGSTSAASQSVQTHSVPFPLAPHALHPSTQSNASTSVFSSGYITPADEIASSAFQSSRASTPIVVFDPAVDDDIFASDLPSLHAGMHAVLERLVQIRSGHRSSHVSSSLLPSSSSISLKSVDSAATAPLATALRSAHSLSRSNSAPASPLRSSSLPAALPPLHLERADAEHKPMVVDTSVTASALGAQHAHPPKSPQNAHFSGHALHQHNRHGGNRMSSRSYHDRKMMQMVPVFAPQYSPPFTAHGTQPHPAYFAPAKFISARQPNGQSMMIPVNQLQQQVLFPAHAFQFAYGRPPPQSPNAHHSQSRPGPASRVSVGPSMAVEPSPSVLPVAATAVDIQVVPMNLAMPTMPVEPVQAAERVATTETSTAPRAVHTVFSTIMQLSSATPSCVPAPSIGPPSEPIVAAPMAVPAVQQQDKVVRKSWNLVSNNPSAVAAVDYPPLK